MVPIPYGVTYKSKARGTMPKLVRCEQCQFEYLYVIKMSAEGESTSMLFLDNEGAKERSAAEAQRQLQKDLEQGSAVVPCPSCGRIQEHMFPEARAFRYRWLALSALGLVGSAVVLALPSCIYSLMSLLPGENKDFVPWVWVFVASVALCGGALWVLKVVLGRSYDPNSTPVEARIAEGKSMAHSKEDFIKMASQ